MMLRLLILTSVISLATTDTSNAGSSLDLTINGKGLSMGDSRRFAGLRLNFMDRQLERMAGVNFTIWRASRQAMDRAEIDGVAISLLGAGMGRNVRGAMFGLLGAGVKEDAKWLTVAGIAAGTGRSMSGFTFGCVAVGAGRSLSGINLAGAVVGAGRDVTGISLAALAVGAGGSVQGVTASLLAVGAGE